MSRTRTHLATTLAALTCTVGLLAGCGDDGTTDSAEQTSSTEQTAEPSGHEHDAAGLGEYCTAYTDITLMMGGEPDPAAITANIGVLSETAPAEVAEQTTVMADAVEQFLSGGGQDYSVMEAPEFVAAQGEVDPFVFEHCEFDNAIEVAGRDFAFEGIPETMPGGQVAMLFTNEGAEAHEIVIVRRNDGVTEPFEELLALPEEEAMNKVTFVGGAFAAASGSSGLLLGEFEPGDYIAVCFVSVGTTMTDGEMVPGTGDPHFAHGMQQEFTVTA